MTDSTTPPSKLGHRPAFWATCLLLSFAGLAALRLTGAIEGPAVLLLALVPMGMLFPLVRSFERAQAANGCASLAIRRYNRGMLAAASAYVLGLGLAITLHRNFTLGLATTWVIAFLPILPIFAMIWVMARYLREESDEYLRHRAIVASLVGLGVVLGLGSFWGFLETFGLVPHMPGWWAVPIWAIGMGLAQMWMRVRER